MQMRQSVTEDQVAWLRMLETRDVENGSERFAIPEDVLDALVAKGFVRRLRDGEVALTLGGMREAALY